MVACFRWTVGVVAATLLMTSLAGAQAAATMKIGVVDSQRVAQESEQGKRLQEQLTALQQSKQSALVDKGKQLQALEQQYAEQSLSLSEDRRAGLQIAIERRKLELENARQLATQEFQLEFAGAQSSFNEMLIRGITSFGRSEGFDLILDAGAVAYFGEAIDVTTAIIDRFDAMFPLAEGKEAGE